jgi:hypothetical protein
MDLRYGTASVLRDTDFVFDCIRKAKKTYSRVSGNYRAHNKWTTAASGQGQDIHVTDKNDETTTNHRKWEICNTNTKEWGLRPILQLNV